MPWRYTCVIKKFKISKRKVAFSSWSFELCVSRVRWSRRCALEPPQSQSMVSRNTMQTCRLQQRSTPGVAQEATHDLLCLFQKTPAPQLTVGRDETSSDITLTSNVIPLLISRKHAHIAFCQRTGVLSICDTSSNGTFVNYQRLTREVEEPLREGDIISFGGGESVWHGVQVSDP